MNYLTLEELESELDLLCKEEQVENEEQLSCTWHPREVWNSESSKWEWYWVICKDGWPQ